MKKQTVNQVILEVLHKASRPLTTSEIYENIIKDELYKFNSANPENIVRTQLRRHSENLDFPKASTKKYFIYNHNGTYSLKD
jgi:restriction system protein